MRLGGKVAHVSSLDSSIRRASKAIGRVVQI